MMAENLTGKVGLFFWLLIVKKQIKDGRNKWGVYVGC
jgi:hypothetical protein